MCAVAPELMLLALLLLPLLPALAASAAAPLAPHALVGAHYFGGWCVPVCVCVAIAVKWRAALSVAMPQSVILTIRAQSLSVDPALQVLLCWPEPVGIQVLRPLQRRPSPTGSRSTMNAAPCSATSQSTPRQSHRKLRLQTQTSCVVPPGCPRSAPLTHRPGFFLDAVLRRRR